MNLFHFSDEGSIDVFLPRVKENRKELPPVVWAIDEEHEFTFFFPRSCPRIVYTRSDEMSDEDRRAFFGATQANIVVTVETGWYERIKRSTVYRYRMPAETFELFDAIAGYYISPRSIVPLGMEPFDRLLDRLIARGVEVRFTPNLHPLREAILNSTLTDFGIHKFDNALRA